jgi:hypothetical protein
MRRSLGILLTGGLLIFGSSVLATGASAATIARPRRAATVSTTPPASA